MQNQPSLALTTGGLYTRDQMAAAFEVEPKTLINWEQELGMPVIKVGRKTVLYDFQAVLAWLRKQNSKAPGQKRRA